MISNKKVIGVCLLVFGVVLIVWIITEHPIFIKSAKDFYCQDWTGFCDNITRGSGKTLWDWLELSSRLAIPILILFIGNQFQRRDKKKSEEQAELDRSLANDNLSEEAMQAYIVRVADLLLEENYRKNIFSGDDSQDDYNSVLSVVRVYTTTILRRLEGDQGRQFRIISFLRDTGLYDFIFEKANLSSINLEGVNFFQANLKKAILLDADLKGANLLKANLREAYLMRAKLGKSSLNRADLGGAFLEKVDLSEAFLEGANLRITDFNNANLSRANLKCVDLYRAKLMEANLKEADLRKAILKEANLKKADLEGADLEGTILEEVCGLTFGQIQLSSSWEKAIYKCQWDGEKRQFVVLEPDNTQFIQNLKKLNSSDPIIF